MYGVLLESLTEHHADALIQNKKLSWNVQHEIEYFASNKFRIWFLAQLWYIHKIRFFYFPCPCSGVFIVSVKHDCLDNKKTYEITHMNLSINIYIHIFLYSKSANVHMFVCGSENIFSYCLFWFLFQVLCGAKFIPTHSHAYSKGRECRKIFFHICIYTQYVDTCFISTFIYIHTYVYTHFVGFLQSRQNPFECPFYVHMGDLCSFYTNGINE